MKVRDLTNYDLDAVMKTEEASFLRPYPRQLMQDLAKQNPKLFVVADQPELGVVGYGIASADREERGHILSIAVHPNQRERGIGGSILAELEKRMSMLGARLLRLEVRISDRPVRHFYERRGYQEQGVLPRYYEDGEDAIVYYKEVP